MKNFIYFCLVTCLSLGMIACGDKEDDDDMPMPECDDTPPTYDGEIKEIIDTNCAISGCHGDGSAPGVFTEFNALEPYITAGIFKTRVIDERSMPQDPRELSAEDYNAIRCWAEGGYLID